MRESVFRRTVLPWLAVAALCAACGGGGGGGSPSLAFSLSGTSPEGGDIEAVRDSAIVVSFTTPADLGTITTATIRLQLADGTPVAGQVLTQNFNKTVVRFQPFAELLPNRRYVIIVSGAIRAENGTPLGAERRVCFITASPTPTVRPDQLVDLGDRLNEPRYLARAVRLQDGRTLVIGGFTSTTAATDTMEVWEPETRTFRVLATRMSTPRAEFSVALLGSRVLISGGVATPGGPPLTSVEIFDPANDGLGALPDLNVGRRWHASSPFFNGEKAMVSGGFDANGDRLRSVEILETGGWTLVDGALPEGGIAQHVQELHDFDRVYIGVGNPEGRGAVFDGLEFLDRQEGDGRRRSVAAFVESDRLFIVGGDTRSMITYDFGANLTIGATDFLNERRGEHTMTRRDGIPGRFLIAGGFNIAAEGTPALATVEVVDWTPQGRFGFADATAYRVEGLVLPVPFAGHVGFNGPDGATILAGGAGDGSGPHSRRVVMILDSNTTPDVSCD